MEDACIQLMNTLLEKSLSDGGFAEISGGNFRPDATAWATLALSRYVAGSSLADQARRRLKDAQFKDGRVPISAENPEAYWPTSICILAWHGSPVFAQSLSSATRFLIGTTGKHWPKESGAPLAHDTSLKGWPWVENTHSWVEPTALALIALRVAGPEHGGHSRIEAAVEMLLDRQLTKGGWNYGNTVVYGRELQGMPDATGLALQSLSGLVPREKIERSLTILQASVSRLHTPFSLSWALLGLSAWGECPKNANVLVSKCLERQDVFGEYTTTQLSLLFLALQAPTGLAEIFENTRQSTK